jgi:hypothetical protein
MENLNNIKRVVTWRTNKNSDGTYTGKAFSFDYGTPEILHAEYVRSSRAKATVTAKKAVGYLKSRKP